MLVSLGVVGVLLEAWRQLRDAAEANTRKLRQLRWVLLHSSPTDSVLDCWSGLGVFRPNPYFYSMLYSQVLSTSERERLAADLISGRMAPKLVFPSHDLLRWVSPDVRAALLKNYMPVPGEGFIFFRITSEEQLHAFLRPPEASSARSARSGGGPK
jgi:hypothetical protein